MKKLFFLFAAFLLLSCSQSEGERCQQDSDCEGSLICCKGGAPSASQSGVCKRSDECVVADASTDTEEETGQDVTETQDTPAEEAAEEPGEDPAQEEVEEMVTDPAAEEAAEELPPEDLPPEDLPAEEVTGEDAGDDPMDVEQEDG